MWTSTLHLEPKRVLLTKLLGLFYSDIYYSSISPLQVQNLPRQPLPSPSWVRVRNRLAGICGSDLHLVFADADLRIAPAALPGHRQLYPGHEVVGEVIEIGDDVQHLQVGDRVALQSNPNCLSAGIHPPCRTCEVGNYNLCEQGTLAGPQPIGGGWSEEMLLHEQQLFRLPAELSDEQGVLLEPMAVAVHTVLRHLPQPGDHVLIIGAGTIGLLTLQVIRALAPQAEVSMLARRASQIEQATRMGAAHIIDPADTYAGVQQVTKAQLYQGIFGNRTLLGGYNVIYDSVGHRNTLHDALRWAHTQATIVLIGVNLHMMHIDLTPIWYQEINLLGTTSHGMEIWPLGTQQRRSTFSIAAELMMQGRVHPEQLITHRFALNNYKDALIAATRKSHSHAIKVVFDYSLQPALVVPNTRDSLRQRRPSLTGAGALKTPHKPIFAASHDNTKDSLLPRRPSPRDVGEFTTAQKVPHDRIGGQTVPSTPPWQTMLPQSQAMWQYEELSEDNNESNQETLTRLPAQKHPPTAPQPSVRNVDIQQRDSTSTATTNSDMTTTIQEFVAQDNLNSVADRALDSAQEEQTTPTVEMSATYEYPSSKAETVLVATESINPEDMQPTVEMAQLLPVKNRQATSDESENRVLTEETEGATDALALIEDTPSMRVRPKRGTRKRKTKPSR